MTALSASSALHVPIEIVPRHVHLSAAHLAHLFGEGYVEHISRPSRLRGQYVAEETVTVCGPDGEYAHVRVLGPCRKETQVELTASEAQAIGIKIVSRLSGDLARSPGCVLQGPKGEVRLRRGVIVPLAHVHLPATDAKQLKVSQGEAVIVKLRQAAVDTFGPVFVRVHPTFRPVIHLSQEDAADLWLDHDAYGMLTPASTGR